MNQKITIFAALNSFYEIGNDLIGVFGNLILLTLSIDKKASLLDIQGLFKNKIQLEIPCDVLRTIIKRLRRNKIVLYSNLKDDSIKSIYLTEKGENKQKEVKDSFKNAEREKNTLLNSVQKFIQDKMNKKYSKEVIENALGIFIEQNSYSAVLMLEGEQKKTVFQDNKLQFCIADYFVESEKSDTSNFERLKTILYGKIISSALLKRNFKKDAKFQSLDVYLDTNIIFSLMGFHEESYNKPVKEIIEIIKRLNFNLKIFSFTKDEIIYKLRGYLKNYGDYSSQVRVDSIYYILKRKGYSKSNIILMIEKIESELEKIGVEIDYSFNIKDLLREKDEDVSKLQAHKLDSSLYSIKHDVAVIFAIKKLREEKDSQLLEKSKFVFLTADAHLASYNFSKYNHKEIGTFPEIIFRSELTSILWLKNQEGGDNAFIHNFIANYIRKKIISDSSWIKFIRELKNQKEKGNITEEEIEIIISYNETEKILREKKEAGIPELINDDKIKIITKKNKKIEKDAEIIEKQIDKIEEISKSIEKRCKKKWNNIIDGIVIMVTLLIIGAILLLVRQNGISDSSIIFGLVFLVFTICFSSYCILKKKKWNFLSFFIDLRRKIENKRIIKCIEKEKKDLNF